MKIMITNNVVEIDSESFVIRVFDAIKCAAATDNVLNIKLDREEVKELAKHIEAVNWIEINEETKEDDN